MSSDTATLVALETQSKAELRYFELIVLKFTGESHQCFCGVGKHGIYFVRRNLSGLYPSTEGGEVLFAHIDRILEDTQGPTDLLVVMNANRAPDWASENIFLVSETRARLVNHIVVAWQTSYTWRFGMVKRLPCLQHPLRKCAQPGLLRVEPWSGWQRVECNGYVLFLPSAYVIDNVNAVQAGTGTMFKDADRDMELTVHIQPCVSLIDLEFVGHDHIRWVAMDYKQHIAEQQQQAVVIKNEFYFKKMNLVNDLASWSGWKMFLKSETHAIVSILFRRQYVPPLLDTAQDMAMTIKCPVSDKVSDDDFLLEAEVIADSMSATVKNCTSYPNVYRDMVQAKLDALLFNEDSTKWIDNMLGLKPKCEIKGRKFLKSVLKMLQDENALNMPDLLNKTDPPNKDINPSHDPMTIPTELRYIEVRKFGEGAIVNAWEARVARYFCSMLDGGLLGKDFTLLDITNAFLITSISQEKQKNIIHFLLHIRPKNMELKYADHSQPDGYMTIPALLRDRNFNDYTFNDRAMQALLELKWVEKCLTPATNGSIQAQSSMSKEYATFMALVLVSDSCSTSLKAAICRQIIAGQQNQPHYSILIPALMETMLQGNLYLTTYCTVTLVNLSRNQEMVKNMLVSKGIAPICADQLQCTDDDLIQYTLVLLTNITKSMHHREVLNRCGIGQVLLGLLFNNFSKDGKQKVLSELCSVIGQLCNDEETRKSMAGPETTTLTCLVDAFKDGHNKTKYKLKSKIMFALKQVSINGSDKDRERIGAKTIPIVIQDFNNMVTKEDEMDMDFAMNGILFLLLLSLSQSNCKLLQKKDNSFPDLMSRIMMTKLWTLEAAREKLTQLQTRIAQSAKYIGAE